MDRVGFILDRVAQNIWSRLDLIRRDFPVIVLSGLPYPGLIRSLLEREGTRSVILLNRVENRQDTECVVVCGDPEWIPFGFKSIDAFISLWDLHHLNDLPGALAQIRRALRPDGLFLSAFPGGESLKALRMHMLEADMQVFGGAHARLHPLIDLADWAGLLQRAGLALPVADNDPLHVDYGDVRRLLHDLRALGESYMLNQPNPPMNPAYLRKLLQIAPAISDQFDMLYGIGWAPSAEQPRPLKPGSAQNRLAEALETEEIGAGEKPGE